MVNRVWLFVLILAVPLFGIAVAEGIQAYYNSELRKVIQQQYPDTDPKQLSQLSLDDICKEPSPELEDICFTNRNLNLMSTGAFWAGIVGLFLVLGIRLAGSAAKSNRRLLLYIFGPGIYLTILVLAGLILIHAAIAVAILYYGESILIGRIHIGLIAAIAIGAFLGVVGMIKNIFSLVHKARTLVIGKMVSKKQAPGLWKRVEEIAQKLGALAPQHIVVGLDPNFFVTEADVTCVDGTLSGRTLYCSLPLCRILNMQEFSAIIAHELGHYKGLDTQFSQNFYPIYRGTSNSLLLLEETGGESSMSIALLPAVAILSYFLECFSVAESRISRIRELAADKEGLSVTDSSTVASALVKIHAFAGAWATVEEASIEALKEGKAFVNASKTYAQLVSDNATPDVLDGIGDTHLSHPTDSHPPLSKRLAELESTIKEVSASALEVNIAQPALDLLPEAEKVEEDLSSAYQGFLAQKLGISLGAETEKK